MKIRSITVFCAPGWPPNRLLLQQLGIFANHARAVFTQEGFEVQTLRMALPPFSRFAAPQHLAAAARELSIEAHAEGFEYLSLGPALTNDLEKVTVKQHPVLNEIKALLMANGARGALMSGSGPTVFGVFADSETAGRAGKSLGQNARWRVFGAHSL